MKPGKSREKEGEARLLRAVPVHQVALSLKVGRLHVAMLRTPQAEAHIPMSLLSGVLAGWGVCTQGRASDARGVGDQHDRCMRWPQRRHNQKINQRVCCRRNKVARRYARAAAAARSGKQPRAHGDTATGERGTAASGQREVERSPSAHHKPTLGARGRRRSGALPENMSKVRFSETSNQAPPPVSQVVRDIAAGSVQVWPLASPSVSKSHFPMIL